MTRRSPRQQRFGALLAAVALIATMFALGTARPAGATDVEPTGLVAFELTAGYLQVNAGQSNEQYFDLTPGNGVAACNDGIDNNDAPPLNVGSDGLVDYFKIDESLFSGTATGGSATTVVDNTQSWATNQWAGKSVWITSGTGAGQSKYIVSNTATTLTISNSFPRTSFSPAPAAGSVYHISNADPECTGPDDNSELAPGFQPIENVVVVANVAADGTMSIPKNVRASEAEARTLGGIYFPPGYVPDASAGMITARFQPAPGSNVNVPATGTINVDTGAIAMNIAVRIKLEGGSGLTDLGSNCYIPSGNNGIALSFTTGTTSPPPPNQPISGSPYNRYTGDYTVVENSFSVGGAGSCGLLGLGNSQINDAFGLPAAAGRNAASFSFRANPKLNYLMAGPVADAGPDRYAHFEALTTLDASGSSDPNGDPLSYSWVQTGGPAVVLTGADTANPTFVTGDEDAVLTFEVTVSSRDQYLCPELPELGEGEELPAECQTASDTDEVTVFVSYNIPPVADAGPDQSGISVGALVNLDGTGSSDANLDELSYSWVQTAGPIVVLDGADTATPSFTAPATGPAMLEFELTVSDGFIGGSDTDSVTIEVIANQEPLANAGPDQTNRKTGQTVTLDGTGSSDPDGHALTYQWIQVSGHTVELSDPTAAQPTFVIPPAPDYVYPHHLVFKLTVADGFGGEDAVGDTVDIEVTATTPTVTAVTRSPSGTVYSGDTVTLSATVNNPDGGQLSYSWSQASGKTTSLSATNVANPTFVVPANGNNSGACTSGTGATSPTSNNCPRFQVQVTNLDTGAGPSANVALAAYASTAPGRPVANAGPDSYIKVNGGTVTLDGTASTQAQGRSLTYQWTQTAGEAVTLSDPTSPQPTFQAPGTEQTLTFSLVVTDPLNPIISGNNQQTSLPDTVDIRIVPDRVVADAGPDQTNRTAGQTITLTAAASTEPNHQPLYFQWEQLSGPSVTLSDPTAVSPTFVAPPASSPSGYTLTFRVTVTNGGPGEDDTDTDTVSVSVVRSTPTVTVSRTPSGTVYTGDTITLTANITNPDGTDPADYTYVWSQVSGRTTPLSSTTAANPTFVVPTSGSSPTSACTSGTGATSPTSANCPRYQVVVTNIHTGAVSTASALAAYGSSLPGRPTADAGPPQTPVVGATVTLQGSGTQAQGRSLNYQWTQTAGPAVVLSGANTATPSFTAPATPGVLTFSLVTIDPLNPITSGSNQNTSLSSTVNVTVHNAPVADAGPDQLVASGALVTLDGSGSTDADGDPLTYSWVQTSGPAVTLNGAATANPTFTAPVGPATLVFTLTVNDGRTGVGTDEVVVEVEAPDLDVSAGLVFPAAGVRLHKEFSNFQVQVTNTASERVTVSTDDIAVSITVNGEPVSGVSPALSTTKSLKPGAAPKFKFTWNHGLGLRAGDVIEITACVAVAGDQNPGNDCATVTFPQGDLDISATAVMDSVRSSYSSTRFRVTAHNGSSGRIVLWPDDVSVSITVNGTPTTGMITNLAAVRGKVLKPGASTNYALRWDHGPTLNPGDEVVVTACISINGDVNPANDCSVITRYVV